MDFINLFQLQSIIDTTLNKQVCVILMAKGCHSCDDFFRIVEDVAEDYDRIDFYIMTVEKPPLFAPGGVPATVIFYQGVRDFEMVGAPDEDSFRKIMDDYLEEFDRRHIH